MMLRKAAPAKINLGLHVLRKRSDGYHDIETLFLQIGWADEVSVEPPAGSKGAEAPAFSGPLHVTPVEDASPAKRLLQVPPGADNLVYRAARCLDPHKGASIELRKHIPVGAGLGGGSSNAATALRLLNDLWGLARSREELISMAASVGADAAFFAAGDAAAFGAGRGDVLKPLMEDGTPYVFPYPLVVAAPPVQVSTAGAYALVQPDDRNRPDMCEVLLSGDPERWRAELTNDFERSYCPDIPESLPRRPLSKKPAPCMLRCPVRDRRCMVHSRTKHRPRKPRMFSADPVASPGGGGCARAVRHENAHAIRNDSPERAGIAYFRRLPIDATLPTFSSLSSPTGAS